MQNAEDFLKAHARILQRDVQAQATNALQRVRVLREFKELEDAAIVEQVQRKHCLTTVALELGARDWNALVAELNANVNDDFGTMWHVLGHWNIWSAQYDEARQIRADHGGYLLPYKKQFMIVEDNYIETLGLNPGDPDWERIGRDWVATTDMTARDRLATQLLRARLE